ncbi:hypothetical protein [Methanosarcina lacustris]|nr:hypothetical protein [Methanosarcina lacustris]
MADRVMDVLINCSPKVASHCEKSSFVGEKIKDMAKKAHRATEK